MELNPVKEEFEDNNVMEAKELENLENVVDDDDYVVASYDISLVPSGRKVFAISGMTPVMSSSKKYDIGIRTDFKSLKITSELNGTKFVAYTKDTNTLLEQNSYAVKLSQEAGKAYMVPINAFQMTSFVDEKDRQTRKLEEDHNDIVQDISELPHPSRNKFNQLAIEMRHYLYKPLKIVQTNQQRQYLNTFFMGAGKPSSAAYSAPEESTSQFKPVVESQKTKLDMLKCDYSRMVRVNFLDIKKIANEEMRAEAFMRKAQLATFYEISSILGVEQQVLMNCLQTYAHLVKGNWVIKSTLLYKTSIYDDETRKKHLEELINLRESLLNSFVMNRRVIFSQVYPKFKKSKDHEEILTRLTCRSGTNQELKFILPEDSFFLSEFSDIAPRHAAKTEVALKKYENFLFS